MSSDKAPDNVYYIKTEKFGFWTTEIKDGEIPEAMYIRQDLIQIGAISDAFTKMALDYEERINNLKKDLKIAKMYQDAEIEDSREEDEDEQRRREMFEKVFLEYLGNPNFSSFTDEKISELAEGTTETILTDSDKFARGES